MINIAYVSNDAYFVPLAVSIKSLISNNENIIFHIMESDISEEHKKILFNIATPNEIIFHNTSEYIAKIDKITSNLGDWKLSFSRLYIGSILKDIDRVLFIDTDTVINGSLEDLYATNLEFNIIGAVKEITESETKNKIGLKVVDSYFNAGLLLIDLKKWRAENIEEQLFEYISNNNGNVYYMDQGTLNHVLHHRIYELDLKYNVTSQLYMLVNNKHRKLEIVDYSYTQSEFMEILKNPVIIHYTGMYRCHPWYEKCIHPMCDIYDYYLSLLPKEVNRKKQSLNLIYRCLSFLYYNTSPSIYETMNKIINKVKRVI